jgi:hypothetical protein
MRSMLTYADADICGCRRMSELSQELSDSRMRSMLTYADVDVCGCGGVRETERFSEQMLGQ